MTLNPRPTGYARLTVWQARSVLVVLVLTAAAGVGLTLSPLASGSAHKREPGEGDVALYRAEIERIHAGESYYQVAGDELRRRGYPTRSVFNWRIPRRSG